jgi:ABC-type metal ion transport system substrate-binding protein
LAKYEIDGLESATSETSFPEGITTRTRRTVYDDLLDDAKKEVKKLVFKEEARAQNVYLALRQKLNPAAKASKAAKDKAKAWANIVVARKGKEVYVGPKPASTK